MKAMGAGLLLVAAFLACNLIPNPASAFTREEEQRIIRQLESMQGQLRDLGERVARIEGRLDGMDRRLDGVEKHVDRMVNIMLAVLGLIGILMGFMFWFARKDFALANRHTTEMTGLKQRLDGLETDLGRLRGAKG